VNLGFKQLKFFAFLLCCDVLLVATFLAGIPLAVSDSFQEHVSVTYSVEAIDYYGKPPGTSGGGKPPSGYSLLGVKRQSLG
jgi:hypothetical protein